MSECSGEIVWRYKGDVGEALACWGAGEGGTPWKVKPFSGRTYRTNI